MGIVEGGGVNDSFPTHHLHFAGLDINIYKLSKCSLRDDSVCRTKFVIKKFSF